MSDKDIRVQHRSYHVVSEMSASNKRVDGVGNLGTIDSQYRYSRPISNRSVGGTKLAWCLAPEAIGVFRLYEIMAHCPDKELASRCRVDFGERHPVQNDVMIVRRH